jgi:hypothetical protein
MDEMEPDFATEPRHMSVLDELIAREPIFHRPEFGTARSDFENMTEADFWEVGASGRRYSRKYVLDTLERRFAEPHEDPWEAREFQCREIALDNYLVTYTLIQGVRVTRRSTIWRRHGEAWRIVYHQGTIVETPPDRALQAEEEPGRSTPVTGWLPPHDGEPNAISQNALAQQPR